MWAAYHEFARGVDEVFRFFIQQFFRQDAFDQLFAVVGDRFMAYVLRMLGGNDHVFNMGRVPVLAISHGHLGLAVRTQPVHMAPLAAFGQFNKNSVGEHDRGRKKFRSFVRGEAKHDALVPRALFRMALALRLAGVHALCNVRGLFRKKVREKDGVRMEHVVILPVAVADLPDGLAGDFFRIDDRLGRQFPGNDDHVAFHQGFARDAASFVLSQAGV